MASRNFSLIDMQDEDHEIDLQFQDFGTISTTSESGIGQNESSQEQTNHISSFPESYDDDQERLLDVESDVTATKPSHSFWTFEYYQQFFNVESKQVGDRILWSMVPKPGVNFLQSYIRPNPDLYGPFWICVTLVFTTAVTGNLANYLQTPESYKWRYDFHKVTLATSCIFSYSWLVPLLLWGLLQLRGSKASLSLLELTALYGYSLAIFVPVSLLWMIPLKWLQWCLGIVASVLSGSVLVRTIHPAISHEAKRIALTIAAVILILHAVLALGFMLYFFYPPSMALSTAEATQSLNNKTRALNKDNDSKLAITDLAVKKVDSVSKREDSEFHENNAKSMNIINSEINNSLEISDSNYAHTSDSLKIKENHDNPKVSTVKTLESNADNSLKVNETKELSKLNINIDQLSKWDADKTAGFFVTTKTLS